mmetsp:Transcript_36314/g.94314  ORF Transcript_36314/g.94314 Transcript_36314/m.94314 type:complete len:211 (+) Transcript_36314:536-1168(+)
MKGRRRSRLDARWRRPPAGWRAAWPCAGMRPARAPRCSTCSTSYAVAWRAPCKRAAPLPTPPAWTRPRRHTAMSWQGKQGRRTGTRGPTPCWPGTLARRVVCCGSSARSARSCRRWRPPYRGTAPPARAAAPSGRRCSWGCSTSWRTHRVARCSRTLGVRPLCFWTRCWMLGQVSCRVWPQHCRPLWRCWSGCCRTLRGGPRWRSTPAAS